jgi:hypothetical protein
MSEPQTSAAALSTIQKTENLGLIKRWQARNRARRDAGHVSYFIYFTHKYGLVLDEDVAISAALHADADDYFAGIVGLVIIPFYGMPLLGIKACKKIHSYLYYGE